MNCASQRQQEEHILNEADQAYYNIRNQLSAKESELSHKVKEKEAASNIC
jgi:chromosome segregation protein